MGEAQEPPSQPPLPYQTWVLRVSIHCQACKTKVKKVLHSIEGVYTTSIDSQHHKVTVTGGNIDAQTLIKKLLKTGKQAHLWPENPPERKSLQNTNNDDDDDDDDNDEDNHRPAPPHDNQNLHHVRITSPRIQPAKSKSVMFNIPPENSSAAVEMKSGGDGGGGGKKKKKKRKGKKKGNSSAGVNSGQANIGMESASAPKMGFPVAPVIVDQINPCHTSENASHFAPSLPQHQGYMVSYRAVAADGRAPAYYSVTTAPPSPPPPYAHASYEAYLMKPTPLDTFEILSDENPNGCRIV